MFDLRKHIVMKIDISDQAQESILSQLNKFKNLHLIAFYLWKFMNSKLNYKIYDKELLVIVKTFKQWKSYLEESKNLIQVYMNYKNLVYFTITKVLN